jgi:hypothetical protein
MAAAEVLFVCTGNVYRSALVERLLRGGFDAPWAPIAVDSGMVPPVAAAGDDATDPYGGNIDRCRTPTAGIVPLVRLLLRLLEPR